MKYLSIFIRIALLAVGQSLDCHQWSKPGGYGKISQCITTTKHSKAKTMCIFLGIYFNWTVHVLKEIPLAIGDSEWLCRPEDVIDAYFYSFEITKHKVLITTTIHAIAIKFMSTAHGYFMLIKESEYTSLKWSTQFRYPFYKKIATHSLQGFSANITKYFIYKYSDICSIANCYICRRRWHAHDARTFIWCRNIVECMPRQWYVLPYYIILRVYIVIIMRIFQTCKWNTGISVIYFIYISDKNNSWLSLIWPSIGDSNICIRLIASHGASSIDILISWWFPW